LSLPFTCVPTRTTGIGMKKFCPICTLSIGFPHFPLYAESPDRKP
jgi:hypothetical protein